MLTFPSNNSLWGCHWEGIYNTYLCQTTTRAEQLGLCDPNQMLFSDPTCKVHYTAPTCVPRASRPALLLLCTEHCWLPATLPSTFITSHKSASTDNFCHSTRERVPALSERMPLLAGKIELLPSYIPAADALAFPLTQIFLIAPGSPLNWNSPCCGGWGKNRYHKSSKAYLIHRCWLLLPGLLGMV